MVLKEEKQLHHSVAATNLSSYTLPVLATENKTSLIPYVLVETVNGLLAAALLELGWGTHTNVQSL